MTSKTAFNSIRYIRNFTFRDEWDTDKKTFNSIRYIRNAKASEDTTAFISLSTPYGTLGTPEDHID